MATILLIERQPLLRLGLRHLFARIGLQAELIELESADMAHPGAGVPYEVDLLVYGLDDESDAGWQALDNACDDLRPRRVLALGSTMGVAPERELRPVVRGFLSKQCGVAVLDAAVRMVMAGGECFPFPVHDRMAAAVATPPDIGAIPGEAVLPSSAGMPMLAGIPVAAMPASLAIAQAANAPHVAETPTAGAHLLNITERQYEVLALLARGYPIKTVSRMLNISVATTKTHACTLYQRLQVRNKGEAVYVALQRGASLNWPGPVAA